MFMANKRKKFSPEEKVSLLRLHLIEKEPVSDICDRNGLNPNVFYRWQKIFFENGTAAFAQTGNGRKDRHSKRSWPSEMPNSPQPERPVKPKGKHHNEKNLDSND